MTGFVTNYIIVAVKWHMFCYPYCQALHVSCTWALWDEFFWRIQERRLSMGVGSRCLALAYAAVLL